MYQPSRTVGGRWSEQQDFAVDAEYFSNTDVGTVRANREVREVITRMLDAWHKRRIQAAASSKQ